MKRVICIFICLAMLPCVAFANNGHWAEKELEQAINLGIIKGGEEGIQPDRPITRAEIVSMLLRTKGETAELTGARFADVSENDWYFYDISYAAGKGYVFGTGGGLFSPDAPVSRQDAAVIICRTLKINVSAGLELSAFTDAMNISDYALGSVAALSAINIINGGADGKFCPLDSLTRAEAAAILLRTKNYLSIQNEVKFARGYPRIASSSLANGFHVAFKTNVPCTIYYTVTDAETAGGAVVPNPSDITAPLITISDTTNETLCFIAVDGQKEYNLFFAAKTPASSSRTSWISRARPHSYTDGDGTSDNPYKIIDEQQLSDIRYQPDKCYRLANNIELSSEWKPIGSENAPFTGTLDGCGYSIRSLLVTEQKNEAGLFSFIGETGIVKNLYVDAQSIEGTHNIGIIAGENSGLIENCQTTGMVNASGNISGGITGSNKGNIVNCMSAANKVSANMYAGGITGYNSGNIDKCAAYVHTVSASAYACGITATNTNGTVKNCLAAELNVLTDVIRNSSRVAINRENGTAENNYAYSRMNAELEDGYRNKDAKNGADISWQELTNIEWFKEHMNWSGKYWSQSQNDAFIAPRLSSLSVPDIAEGSSVYTPKRIASEQELAAINNARNMHYMLSNDIKITKPWTPIASETALLKNNRDGFSGTLNGGGYKIYGLNTYGERQRQMYGLFGMISGGSVFSLIVDGSIKSDGGYAGAIAAVNYGYVENCRTEGTISAENADSIFAGGITGANYGYINDCDSETDISVSGKDATAGGISGYQENYINNCSYKGNINIHPSASRATATAGGIAGYSADGFIYNTYACTQTAISSKISYAGGSVGILGGGELYKSSSKGTIKAGSDNGSAYAGGLCGLADSGLIMNSFSAADVTANADAAYAGGLVGYNVDTSIQDNYAINNVIQKSGSAGFAGGICAVNESGFISSNVAANPRVNCSGRGARICAQSQEDVIYNNYACDNMLINGRKVTDISALSGETVSYQHITAMSFYLLPVSEGGSLGWESEAYGGDGIWDWKPHSNPAYSFPLLHGVKGQGSFRNNRY